MHNAAMVNNPDLHRIAEAHGVRLVRHTGGPPGWYDHARRTISTRRGQSIQQYRSVLAHELAHAVYGDVPVDNGFFNLRQEARADRWAAKLLISPVEFALAAQWHGDCLPAVADELEVTQHLLEVWVETRQRRQLT